MNRKNRPGELGELDEVEKICQQQKDTPNPHIAPPEYHLPDTVYPKYGDIIGIICTVILIFIVGILIGLLI